MERILLSLTIAIVSMAMEISIALAGGGHDHGHAHHDEEVSNDTRGPHGGRLLVDGALEIEVTIFEDGVEPIFRVYGYYDDTQLGPKDLEAQIILTRFGGLREHYVLAPQGDYLTSSIVVQEPHSFIIEVEASYQGREYRWKYDSYEGRTTLSPEALQVAKLSIETTGPATIGSVADVYGKLIPNQDRVAHIRPRFSGLIREIRKDLGSQVKKGEVVAVIESNQSLQSYEIRSSIDGEVVARHGTVGEFVSDQEEILVITDLSEVWADFQVYREDFEQIDRGRGITLNLGGGKKLSATVHYVSPITDEVTQSRLVRAVLQNKDRALRPGSFVSGTIESGQFRVPVAVHASAIQTFRDWDVVFVTDGRVFQAMPVTLGRRDASFVEVLAGIGEGVQYVAENSFIIKADIEKSGASHDH